VQGEGFLKFPSYFGKKPQNDKGELCKNQFISDKEIR
jgi:hypothetical protein